VFGVYQPAFDWLWSRFGDIEQCRLLIDAALMSPLDPVAAEGETTQLVVEDVLPSWRLPRLAEALLNTFWRREDSYKQQLFAHGLTERAGLRSPASILDAMLSRPFSGPTAWTGSAIAMGRTPDASAPPFPAYVEDGVREALKFRRRDSLGLVRSGSGTIEGILPALEFFRDDVFFNWRGPLPEQFPLGFYVKVVGSLVEGCTTMALLYGNGEVGHLQSMESAFHGGLARMGAPEELRRGVSVRKMAEQMLHPPFARTLSWT
jgi:hypothetical protein